MCVIVFVTPRTFLGEFNFRESVSYAGAIRSFLGKSEALILNLMSVFCQNAPMCQYVS